MTSTAGSELRLSVEDVSKDYPLPGPMRLRRAFSRLRGVHFEDGFGAGDISGLAEDDDEMTDEELVEEEESVEGLRPGRRVVDGVTLQAPGGCAIAVTGPEGAGKTVLLKLIGGIVPPSEGRVVVRGSVVPALNVMGLVLPVRGDTVKSALPQLGAMVGIAPSLVRGRFDDIARLMEAPALLKSSTALMESRRRRELILAMALSLEPDVLLLDIPIPDDPFGDRCLARLAELRGRGTLILAEARDSEKLRLAVDRVVVLEEGRVVDPRAGSEPAGTGASQTEVEPKDADRQSPATEDAGPKSDVESVLDAIDRLTPAKRKALYRMLPVAGAAVGKSDVDSVVDAIERLTPAKRKTVYQAVPDLAALFAKTDVESVMEAIGRLTAAKRKAAYKALSSPAGDSPPAPKTDVDGALDAVYRLTAAKRMAVYEALPMPEIDLGEGVTVTARSRKELRRLDRGVDATMLEWLGGLSRGDVLYDVGANCGSLALAVGAMHAGDVNVVAIEPGSANFESLVRNVSRNNMLDFVIPLHMALLDRSGLVPMRYHTATTAGSYRHAVDRPLDVMDGEFTPVATQTIPAFTLDSLRDTLGLPAPTHLKIGVDGTEERVVKGASRTLSDGGVGELMIEIIVADRMPSRLASVQRILDEHGYELVGIFEHRPEAAEGRPIADHHFIRR